MEHELTKIESLIPKYGICATHISSQGVGWHLEHSLKVILGVLSTLEKSDPARYKWKFNLSRTVVYTIGRIPRGKARAPKAVQPEGLSVPEDIQPLLDKARKFVQNLDKMPARANFDHPVFGNLNKRQAIRFLRLHTQHHLHIVSDILKGQP